MHGSLQCTHTSIVSRRHLLPKYSMYAYLCVCAAFRIGMSKSVNTSYSGHLHASSTYLHAVSIFTPIPQLYSIYLHTRIRIYWRTGLIFTAHLSVQLRCRMTLSVSYVFSFPLWLSYTPLHPGWMPHRLTKLVRSVEKPEVTEAYFLLDTVSGQCSRLAAHIAYYLNSLTYNTTLG